MFKKLVLPSVSSKNLESLKETSFPPNSISQDITITPKIQYNHPSMNQKTTNHSKPKCSSILFGWYFPWMVDFLCNTQKLSMSFSVFLSVFETQMRRQWTVKSCCKRKALLRKLSLSLFHRLSFLSNISSQLNWPFSWFSGSSVFIPMRMRYIGKI